MDYSNNKISTLSNESLPYFIRDDHPQFALFIKKYYEFLEEYEPVLKEGRVIERLNNLLNNIDIDNTTHDEIDEELYKKFIVNFPKETKANRDVILKYAKQFYRGKGTEKSLKFLLTVLSGESGIEFYYPKRDILIASDGKWFVQKLLRVQDTRIDGELDDSISTLEKFINLEINSTTSNGSAAVETVNRFFDRGILVSELSISDTKGTFGSHDQIIGHYSDEEGQHTLTANVFGDQVINIIINDGGSGYQVGQYINFSSNTGSGANAMISGVSSGNVSGVAVFYGGSGFRVGDGVLFTGSTGANAYVDLVDDSGTVHPNTYFISDTTIELEANTPLDNVVYSNLNSTNANSVIYDSLTFYAFGNTGPAMVVLVDVPSANLSTVPSATIRGNTHIRALGVLGSMEIFEPGQDYHVGDSLIFTGGTGYSASAEVTEIDGNGGITKVEFVPVTGFYTGGEGYSMASLPSVSVSSNTGTGANVMVTSVLGFGDTLYVSNSSIGAIQQVSLISGGSGYSTAPDIDMTQQGDGNADLEALVISGLRTLPGIFLNDDGFLSSHNYLRGYHYYQNHSYVIRTRFSLGKYVDIIRELVHPGGTKFFADLIIEMDSVDDYEYDADVQRVSYRTGTFSSTGNNVTVTLQDHGLANNEEVYLDFESSNLVSSLYKSTLINSDSFTIINDESDTATGNVAVGIGYS